MSVFSRLRNVVRRDRISDEIEREMAFHLAERTEELVASGMPRKTAEREARRRFGNVTLRKEDTREQDVAVWLEAVFADLRYGIRVLRASPGFTIVAVLSLALGIGANTAIFTVIEEVMLEALPVAEPDRLALLTRQGDRSAKGSPSFTAALWEELRTHQNGVGRMFAYGSSDVDLSMGGEARRVPAGFVSDDFFAALGTRPAAGRLLGAGDDPPAPATDCRAIAVLSHAFWRSEYGAGPGAVGALLPLDGHPFDIVGVAEPAFFGVEIGYQPRVWLPLCAERILRGAATGGYRGRMGRLVMLRLPPGVSLEEAGARVAALAPALIEATGIPRTTTLGLVPFAKGIPDLRTGYGDSLLALMAVVAVVLLIACANVANLLLARATARQREIAVRLALGASRWRVVRQLLTESMLLSLSGAALGILFASWGSRSLVQLLSPPGRPVALPLTLNPVVLGFTIGVAVATGVIFGLAPAWRAGRIDAHAAMRSGGRGALEGHSRFHAGKAIVIAQIALSLAAISAAALLLDSWRRLATLDPGCDRHDVLLGAADTRKAGIADAAQAATYARILERLREMPGVTAASGSSRTPIDSVSWTTAIEVEGLTPRPIASAIVQLNDVTDGYFPVMSIPIRAGRDFTPADGPAAPRVAVVSEELACRFFGADSAIGRRFRWQLVNDFSAPIEFVGVAGDSKLRSLRAASPPIAYLASRQNARPGPSMTFAIRSAASVPSLVAQVKAAFADVDPRISLKLTTLEQQVDGSLHLVRAMGLLSGVFGAMALALAALGLYGLVSYSVARRKNEIGVRIALGAERTRIMRMVFGDVGRLVTAGLVVGVPLSFAVRRLVMSLLYGVSPGDPATLALSMIVLATVAAGAAFLPARRAAWLNPVAALRED